MSELAPQKPDGLILCGGRGRRMHGTDKGLRPWDGYMAAESAGEFSDTARAPLAVEHAARQLAGVCGDLFISANRNLDAYAALQIATLVVDVRAHYPGPLAGLEAVRDQMRSDRLLVLPCDLPDMRAEIPAALLHALDQNHRLDGVYAHSESGHHYLCAALRRRALDGVGAELDRGQRAVRVWYAGLHIQAVPFEGVLGDSFRNVNLPEDCRGPDPEDKTSRQAP